MEINNKLEELGAIKDLNDDFKIQDGPERPRIEES